MVIQINAPTSINKCRHVSCSQPHKYNRKGTRVVSIGVVYRNQLMAAPAGSAVISQSTPVILLLFKSDNSQPSSVSFTKPIHYWYRFHWTIIFCCTPNFSVQTCVSVTLLWIGPTQHGIPVLFWIVLSESSLWALDNLILIFSHLKLWIAIKWLKIGWTCEI